MQRISEVGASTRVALRVEVAGPDRPAGPAGDLDRAIELAEGDRDVLQQVSQYACCVLHVAQVTVVVSETRLLLLEQGLLLAFGVKNLILEFTDDEFLRFELAIAKLLDQSLCCASELLEVVCSLFDFRSIKHWIIYTLLVQATL